MSGYKIIVTPTDKVYVYDGSLVGFFTCVHESIYARELPLSIFNEKEIQPTLYIQKYIDTNFDKAAKVRTSIQKNISQRTLDLVETTFLCHHEDKEIALLAFLITAFRVGSKAPYMMGEAEVAKVLGMEKHILGEAHLLSGFIRFADYGNILVAVISPKNFVLPIIASHFINRFPEENFIIYDNVHKAALVYQDKSVEITAVEEIEFQQESATELHYQALWKQFYKTIGIAERLNPKCRMTHMPKRYWENMLEMREFL